MSHTVDQARMVKGFLVEQFFQIISHLAFIAPVRYFPFHFFKHLHHFDIGAAVAGAF